jgi:L-amino acid N-acyltransferase YncA
MESLIRAAAQAGFWKLVSRIFTENHASLRLCRSLGFRQVGTYEKHGQLDGVWRDVVIVEKLLNPPPPTSAPTPPAAAADTPLHAKPSPS